MRVRWRDCALGAIALSLGAPLHADVSTGELTRTCQTALDRSYQGLEAAMCDWWVRPCGVCGASNAPREWCIPETIKNADLAVLVVNELKTETGLEGETAEVAVNRILRAHYPCAAQDGSHD